MDRRAFFKTFSTSLMVAAALVAAAPEVPADSGPGSGGGGGGRLLLRARLRPPAGAVDPDAVGNATFERRSDRVRLSVEVERISTADVVRVLITRDGAVLLDEVVPVNAFGVADLNLDSRDGDDVPALRAGDLVRVFDEGGHLLVRGKFVRI